MEKKTLKFKVDGGLDKVHALYNELDTRADALGTLWQHPAESFSDIIGSCGREIRLSSGYKQLADNLDNIDYDICRAAMRAEPCVDEDSLNMQAFTSLWNAVGGAGRKEIDASVFKNASRLTVTVSVTVLMLMTVTVTTTTTTTLTRGPTPRAPGRIDNGFLAGHARTVADQLGWFA